MRTFALVWGLLFTGAGILGFIPALLAPPVDGSALAIDGGYGHLLGLFPVNWVHNLVHLAFGIWGLSASRGWGASRAYTRSVAVVYGLLVVMGFFPVLNTTFGLIPIYGHDIWLHALLAAPAAYFGWFVTAPVEARIDGRVRT